MLCRGKSIIFGTAFLIFKFTPTRTHSDRTHKAKVLQLSYSDNHHEIFRTSKYCIHCDKSHGISQLLYTVWSAVGNNFSMGNCPRFLFHGHTKLNLGQKPAIAGNIPRFYHINLLLNKVLILKH